MNIINTSTFLIIIFAVFLNTTAQLVMKIGMTKIGFFEFVWSNFIPVLLKIAFSPWIILGVTIYVISCGVWLMVLSRTPVSVAYPMSSLAYITSSIAACFILHETMTLPKIAGVILILFGVYLVAKA